MASAEKPHFHEAGFKFLRSLKRHNERDWFNPRKPIYEAEIKAPMLALIAAINAAFEDFAPDFVRDPAKCMMRIYRDTRFSKDKLPYKDHAAAWWAKSGMEKTSGAGFYLDVSPTQLTIAAGCYMPEREQLLAIRRHLLDRHQQYRTLLGNKTLKTLGMTAFDPVKMTRPPKGFSSDHPALDLILQRQWGIAAHLPAELALQPTLAIEIVKRFRAATPLVSLLNEPLVPVAKSPFGMRNMA
jgi:uncharacterized protein (TIGR02453 family)